MLHQSSKIGLVTIVHQWRRKFYKLIAFISVLLRVLLKICPLANLFHRNCFAAHILILPELLPGIPSHTLNYYTLLFFSRYSFNPCSWSHVSVCSVRIIFYTTLYRWLISINVLVLLYNDKWYSPWDPSTYEIVSHR